MESAFLSITTVVVVTIIATGLWVAVLYGETDYRRNLTCERAGGVAMVINHEYACARVDGFIPLPELRP